jgi:acetate kinase
VVHGGEHFSDSQRIDEGVCAVIEECSPLAPLHNPANLLGIRAAQKALPDLVHVAVFDTAFHQTMPPAAYRYAVPESWYSEHRVRRYGFHGTSHRYVSALAAGELNRDLSEINLITAHLGNGCSLAAVSGGQCVDTTMGLTPLEGLVMGTRSGDIDPGALFHMHEHAGMSVDSLNETLNKESGLLGLSRLSNDMRQLSEAADEDPRAQLAIDVFCHRLAKAIGSMATSFSHVDAIVFTGGIGQNSSLVRRKVCERLAVLGVHLDLEKNEAHQVRIESASSALSVLVLATNEELLIARDTSKFV